MLVKSYIFSTIALVIGLFIGGLFIPLPFCFIFALIGLYYVVKNYKRNESSFIANIIALVYNGFVIFLLIFMFMYMLSLEITSDVGLIIF